MYKRQFCFRTFFMYLTASNCTDGNKDHTSDQQKLTANLLASPVGMPHFFLLFHLYKILSYSNQVQPKKRVVLKNIIQQSGKRDNLRDIKILLITAYFRSYLFYQAKGRKPFGNMLFQEALRSVSCFQEMKKMRTRYLVSQTFFCGCPG